MSFHRVVLIGVLALCVLPLQAALSEPLVSDVKPSHWAREDVEKLVGRGVLKLYPDQAFRGDQHVKRYEMAAALARLIQDIEEKKITSVPGEDVAHLRNLLKEMTSELANLSQKQEVLAVKEEATEERVAVLEKKTESRLEKLEKKIPLELSGDFRYRYGHSWIEDNEGGRGSTTNNANRFRLYAKYKVDPTLTLVARWRGDQPVRRGADADGVTTFRMDLLYLDKKDFLGGDWRMGRQKFRLGNGMVYMGYLDGFRYNRTFSDQWGIVGVVAAENTVEKEKTKSHGWNANILGLEYKPTRNHSILLSSLVNNAEIDKYGVVPQDDPKTKRKTPATKEGWISLDLVGTFTPKLNYFGTMAAYRNQLDENNTKDDQKHLRGDIENLGYMMGLNYKASKKWTMGTLFALQEDNFRPLFSYSDFLYARDSNYCPLEEACNALSLSAVNARTNAAETIFPPNAKTAFPAATPLARIGEVRGTGSSLADIHGYKDFQVSGNYSLSKDLDLKLIGNWLTPAKSAYNYRDISSVAFRLWYRYNPKTNLELKGLRVTSDYGRSASDIRTELFIRY